MNASKEDLLLRTEDFSAQVSELEPLINQLIMELKEGTNEEIIQAMLDLREHTGHLDIPNLDDWIETMYGMS